MFIEFNGIPGCGKSTICKKLIACLDESGENVLFLQDRIAKLAGQKATLPFLIFIEGLHGAGAIVVAYLKLYKSIPYRHRETLIRTFAALKNAVLAYRMCRKNKDVVIISDQCIVQNILSCFYDCPIQNGAVIEELLNTISSKLGLFIAINVEIDVETASSRIQDRNTVGGRLDLLRGNHLTETLSRQSTILKQIRTLNRGIAITIDSSESPDDNAKLLFDYIKGVKTI